MVALEGILGIQIGIDMGDDEDLAELAAQLREELLQLDVESVDFVDGGEVPPGTKGAELVAVGGLVVRLVTSTPVLRTLAGALKSWLSRAPGRSIQLTIDGDVLDVSGITAEEQSRLIDVWVARHADGMS